MEDRGTLRTQSPYEARQVHQVPGLGEGRHLVELDAEVTRARDEAGQGGMAVMQQHGPPACPVQPSQQLKHDALGSTETVAVGVVDDGLSHRVTPSLR